MSKFRRRPTGQPKRARRAASARFTSLYATGLAATMAGALWMAFSGSPAQRSRHPGPTQERPVLQAGNHVAGNGAETTHATAGPAAGEP